jgi:hypothetical protein
MRMLQFDSSQELRTRSRKNFSTWAAIEIFFLLGTWSETKTVFSKWNRAVPRTYEWCKLQRRKDD